MNQHSPENWSADKRIAAVKRIFGTIAPHYDLLNHLLSGGQDIRWRNRTVKRLPADTRLVLDIACGTGDLSLAVAKRRPETKVIGLDFVRSMLDLARIKTDRAGLVSRVHHTAGDAMHLPFANHRFDAAMVAFGFRNMPDRARALAEMRRVVKSGGKVLVLEMTLPRGMRMRRFFVWYLNTIIPRLGGLISGNREAYQYLPDSIAGFLKPEELSNLFEGAGLREIRAFPLTYGIAYLHEGLVP
ncbi:MAG: bifunctional demethylmenaquinone methyltransferase/2-methoxy-6-polyprenyl-1,4-benzoquinol methylase UbiE [candidate division Zixibacteria bacterium]|nr:bifunctional demethylmenaquinone methyltransferase/2-methoxy-6-polyprenyl-1,4-benzoquinol methylase UbiE [candidate division Zixibacteria bacterium]